MHDHRFTKLASAGDDHQLTEVWHCPECGANRIKKLTTQLEPDGTTCAVIVVTNAQYEPRPYFDPWGKEVRAS